MAKTVSVKRPHNTTKEDAQAKLAGLARELESKYGVKVNVQGAGATVSGKGVSGGCTIDDTHVAIDLKLGLPASMVAGKIESGVEKAISQHFG
ncbi:MAG: polyhydroxyalkanoic acid system family protein [Myxococcales bacterium]|jgi:putative polyhydroxyalkanoate system protein|nr:polyhydroxyalkanoic acid system family protein [Myxococcales bacterium]